MFVYTEKAKGIKTVYLQGIVDISDETSYGSYQALFDAVKNDWGIEWGELSEEEIDEQIPSSIYEIELKDIEEMEKSDIETLISFGYVKEIVED